MTASKHEIDDAFRRHVEVVKQNAEAAAKSISDGQTAMIDSINRQSESFGNMIIDGQNALHSHVQKFGSAVHETRDSRSYPAP